MKPYRKGTGWAVRYDLGPDPETGARRQRMLTGKTRKEVEQKYAAALVARDAGGAVDPTKLTVGQYLDHWLARAVAGGRRAPGTAYRYRGIVERYAKPHLGALRLTALTAERLSRLYDDLLAAGLAPATVRGVHQALHAALKQAVRWRFLAASVADAVAAPRAARYEPAVWDGATATRFRASLEADHYGPLFAVAIVTGLRRGELLGLRWEDVDLAAATLAVRRQRVEVGGQMLVTPTKSRRARVLELSAEQVAFLRWHRDGQAAALPPAAARPGAAAGYVFVTRAGGPIAATTYNRAWAQLVARAGVPYCRPHDLRHLNATLLLKARVHPKIVQERLGHANIGITLDTYSHVAPGLGREAAGLLDDALRAPAPPPDPPLDGAAADE